MASFGKRLKKYVTLSYLHELITDPAKVGTASREGAGLMSPDHVRKLERVEDNATGDMTSAEIIFALQRLKESIDIDVRRLGGKTAGDFASSSHLHDDRYMPRGQINEALVEFSKKLAEWAHNSTASFDNVGRDIDALRDLIDKCAKTEDIDRLLAAVNAVKIGGKSLEDLDRRYAQTELVAAFVPSRTAHSGGVVKGGQYSPDPSKGPLFRYTNGGNHVFALPASKNDYELKVAITHGKDAGRIEFEDGQVFYGEHHVGKTTLVVVTKIGSYIDIEVR